MHNVTKINTWESKKRDRNTSAWEDSYNIRGKVQKQRHCRACVYFPEAAGHQLVPSQAVRRWPSDWAGSPRAKASSDVQYGGWADNLCGEGGSLGHFCLFFCRFASLKRFFSYSFVFSWYLGVRCIQSLWARGSLTMLSLSHSFHPKQKCLSLAVIRRVWICWIDSSTNTGSCQTDNSTNGAGRSKRKAFELGEKEIKTFLWCSQAWEIKRKHFNLWLFHVKRCHNSAKKNDENEMKDITPFLLHGADPLFRL